LNTQGLYIKQKRSELMAESISVQCSPIDRADCLRGSSRSWDQL